MRLGGETVVIVRASAPPDAFGDVDPSAAQTETTVTGCSVQPASTAEEVDRRETVTQALTVWLPPGTDIGATDRLRWRGELYEVDGRPVRWDDHAGREHHLAVPIRRITG